MGNHHHDANDHDAHQLATACAINSGIIQGRYVGPVRNRRLSQHETQFSAHGQRN